MKIEPGQVAVVTGAASGIGLGLAEALSIRGVRIVLADIHADELLKAESTLRERGATVCSMPVDVRDFDAIAQLATVTMDEYGQVDIVCNNAGVVGPQAPMWEQDPKIWDWVLGVDLMGVVHGIRAFVPLLAAAGQGHILNTASTGGLIPQPEIGPYSAAKHAVIGITETLRAELAVHAPNVSATALCPGGVVTNFGANSKANRPEGLTLLPNPNPPPLPAGRGTLTVEQVAAAALDGIERDLAHVIAFSGPYYTAGIQARLDAISTAMARRYII